MNFYKTLKGFAGVLSGKGRMVELSGESDLASALEAQPGSLKGLDDDIEEKALEVTYPIVRNGQAISKSNPESFGWGSHTAYLCVNLNANVTASMNLTVKIKKGDTWVEDEENKVFQLLENPSFDLDMQSLVSFIVASLEVAGKAGLLKIRYNGEIVDLFPLKPSMFEPNFKNNQIESFTVFLDKGKKRIVKRDDIIFFKYDKPGDPTSFISPLYVSRYSTETEAEAIRWNLSSFNNRALSDFVLISKEKLNDVQYRKARRNLREQLQGAANAWQPALIPNDFDIKTIGRNQADLDFTEGRKVNREDICSIFGVPVAIANYISDIKYSNFETSMQSYLMLKVLPLSRKICSVLSSSLKKDFQIEFYIEPDTSIYSAFISQIPENVRESAKTFFAMGVPFKQINRRFNLGFEEFEGDDVSYINGIAYGSDFDDSQAGLKKIDDGKSNLDEARKRLINVLDFVKIQK
jgi:HK97 family phage portal protein